MLLNCVWYFVIILGGNMKNIIKQSVLALALCSPWVNAAVDGTKDHCNATEGLDGWAIWCGVDTYLAQQEPTAAGPLDGEGLALGLPSVRTAAFGGAVESLTPLGRMAEFVEQGRIAEYSGSGIYSGLGRVDNIIKVRFGEATWFGAWFGPLNIGASGTISGNQFSSTAINAFAPPSSPPSSLGSSEEAFNSVVTGTINGNFNNNNASVLTGVVDVVKDGQAIVGTFENEL